MILKQIYIYPDLVEFPIKVTGPYRDKSRHFCNYIERELKALKYQAHGFNKICIVGFSNPSGPSLNASGALTIPFKFEEKIFSRIAKEDAGKYFSDLFIGAIEGYNGKYLIPSQVLIEAAERFTRVGYINEWIIKERKLRKEAVILSLKGRLSPEKFQLLLCIEMKDGSLAVKEVLATPPDEVYFAGVVYGVDYKDGVVNVTDNFKQILFATNLETLSS